MTTPTSTPTSWLEWFNSRDSADTINKSHQAELFAAFGPDDEPDKCIEDIIQHEETVFLLKANLGTSNVNSFHHLKKAGGTLNQPTISYGFLQGVGKDTTWTMTPDTDILGKKPTLAVVATPTPANLNGVTSIANVEALVLSASIVYKPRIFILIPPFLLRTIQNTNSK